MACVFAACSMPATFVVAAILGGLIYRFSPAKRLLCCGSGLIVSTIFAVAVTHAVFHSFFAYSTVQSHSVFTSDKVPPAAAKAEPIAKHLPSPFVDFVADVWRNQYGPIDSRITDAKFKDTLVMMGYANGVVTPVIFLFVYLAHLFGIRMAVPMQLAASVWLAGTTYTWFGTEFAAGMPHISNHQQFFAMAALPVIIPILLMMTAFLTLCCCPVGKKEKDDSRKSTKKSQ